MLNSSSFKRAISYFAFSVTGSLLTFFTVPYLTRVLSPADFGFVGLFMSLFYVIGPLSSFSAVGLVGINKVKFTPEDYQRFSVDFIYFCVQIFLILMLTGVVSSFVFESYRFIFFFLPLLGIIRVLNSIHSTELVQDGRANLFGALNLFTAIVTFVLTVVSLSLLELSWHGRILAICCAELFVLVVRYSFVSKKKFKMKALPSWDSARGYICYGAPLIISLGATWIINEADKFIVLKYFSMADVGLYTAAYSVGLIISVVNNSMVNAVAPKIYGSLHAGNGATFIKKLNVYYSLGILSFAFLISLLAYFGADWYFGDKYLGSFGIVATTAFAFAFSGVYRTVGLVIDFYKRTKLRAVLLYVCAFSNVAMSIGLIPFLGILAPAVGTLVSYILLAILVTGYSRKELISRGVES